MARLKATAGFMCAPGQGPLRRSSRLKPRRTSSPPQPFESWNPQSECPFFRSLPFELRTRIFEFALTSYEDVYKPRSITRNESCDHQNDYQMYRPGHFCHRRISTDLLRTCKLIYLETSLLPASINTHTLCYDWSPGLSFPIPSVAKTYFKKMSAEQLQSVRHIQLFVASSRLRTKDPGRFRSETPFAELGYLREPLDTDAEPLSDGGTPMEVYGRWDSLGGPYPKTLIMTIRHFDWRGSFSGYGFDLGPMLENKHWENVFGGLNLLKMELEVQERHRPLLEPTVQRLLDFTFDIGQGKMLAASDVQETTWTGLVDFGTWPAPEWEDAKISVTTITWQAKPGGHGPVDPNALR